MSHESNYDGSMMQVDPVALAAYALHTSPGTYAVLLGSGLSSAAGIPTGWDITLDLARCVASIDDDGPDDPEQWYQSRFGAELDYSRLLKKLGSTQAERQKILRRYIEPTADHRARGLRVPTNAHKAVAELAASGHLRVIVTTNFDQLIERALEDAGVTFDVVANDDSLAGARPLGQATCHVIKLHGDYKDSRIRNTTAELAEYTDQFNSLLDRILDEYGLIVCGWSATWDSALRDAITRQPNRRYTTWWVTRGPLSSEAAELVAARRATVIESADADTFFGSLASKVTALTEVDRPHPISVATAVAELKHLLPDPTHRIRLRDLVCGEARRLRSACGETNFPLSQHLDEEQMRARVAAYEGQTELLETLFGIGCAWDTDPLPFVEALKITAEASHMTAGQTDLLKLRRYPALRCLYTGGMAAVYHQRWDMLRALTADATTDSRDGPLPMATALNYWSIFNNSNRGNWLPDQSRNYTPVSSHLFKTLRETLADTIAVGNEYEAVFDRFEYIFGLIIEDLRDQLPNDIYTPSPHVGYVTRNWYPTSGPSLWERIKTEAEQAGANWGPLQAGLFGGSFAQFATTEEKYRNRVLKALQYRR